MCQQVRLLEWAAVMAVARFHSFSAHPEYGPLQRLPKQGNNAPRHTAAYGKQIPKTFPKPSTALVIRLRDFLLKWESTIWFTVTLVILISGITTSWLFWGQLTEDTGSISTAIRNVALVIGGTAAIILALWRSRIHERQANTAEQGLLNERYQRGAEMLGHSIPSVRMAGINALRSLADSYPEQYHCQVVGLLCAFLRHPTKDVSIVTPMTLRADVQEAITVVGRRSKRGISIERKANLNLDLHGADLSCGQLSGMNLAGANLSHAKLQNASFSSLPYTQPDPSEPLSPSPNKQVASVTVYMKPVGPDLSGLEEHLTDLSSAILERADLSGAKFLGTDLSAADLTNANVANCEMIYIRLRRTDLIGANLSGASILSSDLSGARLAHANLNDAALPGTDPCGANLPFASFEGTDLSSTILSKESGKYTTTGLTQGQIDEAVFNTNNPPDLTGVTDLETGQQLVWKLPGVNDTN